MDETTVNTYNRAAIAYAEKFKGIGARITCIEKAVKAWGGEKPRVLEIGCGDGRDAIEIAKRAKSYIGFDISEEFIKLARQKAPQLSFQIADVGEYDFSKEQDIFFAFASLLHVDKESFASILKKAHACLAPGGVFFLSVKRGPYKGAEVVSDEYGDRLFYYYQAKDIEEIAEGYAIISKTEQTMGTTPWLDMILKKQ